MIPYYVDGQRFYADENAKLGSGSEGFVVAFDADPENICAKILHPPDLNNPDEIQIAAYRAKKLEAYVKLNLKLPPQFIIPQKLVTKNPRDSVNGYLMRRVPRGYVKLMRLLDPAFRTSNSIGLRQIALLYAQIFEDLAILEREPNIHAIQDINLGCNLVRFNGDKIELVWVDTDSYSIPRYPCLATTEIFCHPDLYPNLRSGGSIVNATPIHDRFAYTVEFCLMAVHGAHPFRMGIHPKASGLQERAERGITIFDKDVEYPKFLPSPNVLSDNLLHELTTRLKRKVTSPLPPSLLRDFANELITCSKCGEQYHNSRRNCPKCQEVTMIPVAKLAKLIVEQLYDINGALLFAQVIDAKLRLACKVGNELHIVTVEQDGKYQDIPTDMPVITGAKYRFFEDYLVVCPEPYSEPPAQLKLYKIESTSLINAQISLSTNALENESAVFGTSSRFLYRTTGNTLQCTKMLFGGKTSGDNPVTQVNRTQTWFTVDNAVRDHEALVGYDRSLREMRWFVIKGDKDGKQFSTHDLAVTSLRSREKLLDFAVHFANSSVLLIRLTQYKGRNFIRYSIATLDGEVLQDAIVSPDDEQFETWEQIRNKLFQGPSILHITPNGVVKHILASNQFQELTGTQGFITPRDQLFRFGNVIGIARKGEILTLRTAK